MNVQCAALCDLCYTDSSKNKKSWNTVQYLIHFEVNNTKADLISTKNVAVQVQQEEKQQQLSSTFIRSELNYVFNAIYRIIQYQISAFNFNSNKHFHTSDFTVILNGLFRDVKTEITCVSHYTYDI